MKALDTNVLARFFVDDPDDAQTAVQRPAAIAALSGRCWVGVTVVLEFEWVLRGFYGLARKDVLRILRALCGIEHVTVEDRGAVLDALAAAEQGMDFADALHLTRSKRAVTLLTFDRAFARRATKLGLAPPVEAP